MRMVNVFMKSAISSIATVGAGLVPALIKGHPQEVPLPKV